MKIAILGLGYVGMTAGGCLASLGHEVLGIDPNESKVAAVNAGRSPIVEPELAELVKQAVDAGRLRATVAIDAAMAECELAIVCVGTPSAADGSHNMSFIAEVSRQIALLMKHHVDVRMTVAYRSTVRPGTIDELIEPIFADLLGDEADRIELVYNPEFLRESVAVADFFSPPKIVVGTRTGERCAALDMINDGLDAPVFYVKYREAEMTKFVDNAFHAVKTVFANEIGRVCTKLAVSAATVHEIFVADTKLNISPYYLRPGGAFGGSCLPKDVRALQSMGRITGANLHMIDSLLTSNEAHKEFLYELAATGLPHGSKVLMLGLAFKDRSDDLRESPNIDVVRAFITAGHEISIFDPYVKPASLMGQNLGVLSNSPFIRNMLVGKETIEAERYAVVVDTRGIAANYKLNAERIVNLNALA